MKRRVKNVSVKGKMWGDRVVLKVTQEQLDTHPRYICVDFDDDNTGVINLIATRTQNILNIIRIICGDGFSFNEKNQLDFDGSEGSGRFSPTARDILSKATLSDNIAYILPLTSREVFAVSNRYSGQLGFSVRVQSEPGNTVGAFIFDFLYYDLSREVLDATKNHLNSVFNVSIERAPLLGFIHEFIGHALIDMGIPGFSRSSNNITLEKRITRELGWEIIRKLQDDPVSLDGVMIDISQWKGNQRINNV